MSLELTKEQQEWINGFETVLDTEDICLAFWEDGGYFELNITTPHEGDEYITIYLEEFEDDLRLYRHLQLDDQDNFIDEYVEMWLEAKRNGTGGVPSAKGLVEDGEYILEMREAVYEKFIKYNKEHPYKEVFGKEQSQEKEL